MTARRLGIVALLAWSLASWAEEPSAEHHFAQVSLPKLTLVDVSVRSRGATVEGPGGDLAVVREGDRLGVDALVVRKITRGCLELVSWNEGVEQRSHLCIDESSASPRS